MSARQLLDRLLQSGQGLVQEASSRMQGASPQGGDALGPEGAMPARAGAGSLLSGLGDSLGGLGNLGGFGGGLLGGGALGLLLGSKKVRKMGGQVALYGGMAALGALAYRAYGDWQRQQAAGQITGQPPALSEPQTLDRLPPEQAEQHCNAVLVAMIGAAKADGHIGPAERGQLEAELARLSGDAAERAWLEAELARPLDPAAVARTARTPEMAAEMYLASVMVVDEESYMERAYLDELARQLKLPEGLKQQLEKQVAQAQAA